MEVKIEGITVQLASPDEVRRIELRLAIQDAMLHEIMRAVLGDDAEKIAALTARLKRSSDELHAAVKSASPASP